MNRVEVAAATAGVNREAAMPSDGGHAVIGRGGDDPIVPRWTSLCSF